MPHARPAAAVCALALCLAFLAGCSVDRYDIKGRVVVGAAGSAATASTGALDSPALRPVPHAAVRIVMDAADTLNRRDLGVLRCDEQGRFTLRKMNAPGVEVVPYRLHIEAYAPGFAPLQGEVALPSPGRALILRMAEDPTAPGAAPNFFPPPVPEQGDPLKDALRDGAPYLK